MKRAGTGLYMKYFVLKPAGTDIFAQASREAMLKYATVIKKEDPMFAIEIEFWVSDEKAKVGMLI